ncbi:amino acid ABC transporter substrate-binding protein [Mycolicibacterium flavescens]|uniref:ABC transporter substrate-binding protein n=1 Tax=Mycolicibacterium flavescens TaxID=1776 RepID=A0A1E3RJK4_MYCFV|nr:ABC transporter substrate-binding protein [Mycolicibacterium flavescens]MCV7280582.1 amino acid ABC transporter substrate-binding protein [Mycolicibacterium flavescens]ODQ90034.1 ABC transporter substrate-binding protein [Mycolicibacterium flavescens]
MRTGRMVGTLLAALMAVNACAPAAAPYTAPRPKDCHRDKLATLYDGVFTFGTDQPVYPPWFIGDNPDNGEGFEAAVAYAVADRLGYAAEDVRWVRLPFSEAIVAGPKMFDASLSQVSITDQRKAAVDFSAPYFDVNQAVVTVRSSPAAQARSLADLKGLRLGAQVGTTSHTAAVAVDGDIPVASYNTNGDAKLALGSGEIDALVADLPTAFSVAGELRDGVMVGQLPAAPDTEEQFGLVLAKDSPLTPCVSSIVEALRADGTLARLQTTWLADAGRAPVLA